MRGLQGILQAQGSLREPAALATLVRAKGSSYRQAGARMVLQAGGAQLGVISAGCLETDVKERVGAVLAGGAEVLLVRGPAGELDIPVVRSIVRIFAPKRGEIVVDREALGLTEDAQAADAPEPDDDDEAAGDDAGVDPA